MSGRHRGDPGQRGRAGDSTPLVLRGGTVATPDGPVTGDLVISGGVVTAVPGTPPVSSGQARLVDVTGLVVAPGFVDLQVNGGYGIDLTSELGPHPERLWTLATRLAEQGVTAFLPTIVSAPAAAIEGALTALRLPPPPGHLGAVPLGIHAEGPMLSAAKRGTHDPRHLRPPASGLATGWSRASGVAMVTLAPELPGALPLVADLAARGVVVAIGHTAASYDQATAAFAAGARAATHLFNAMSGWSGRDPGAIGALIAEATAVAGLIVDGVHLHPGTVAALWRALGPDRIALVTDAVAAAGAEDGDHALGGRPLRVHDGAVRDEEGALAGSILTMDRAVRELLAATDAALPAALRAASATPAAVLGDPSRGRLVPGARADVVVLNPRLEVVATLVGGRLAACPRPEAINRAMLAATRDGAPTAARDADRNGEGTPP